MTKFKLIDITLSETFIYRWYMSYIYIYKGNVTWTSWRLKSPVTWFVQQLNKETITKIVITGPLWRESTNDQWIPSQSVSIVEICFLCHNVVMTSWRNWRVIWWWGWPGNMLQQIVGGLDNVMQSRYIAVPYNMILQLRWWPAFRLMVWNDRYFVSWWRHQMERFSA